MEHTVVCNVLSVNSTIALNDKKNDRIGVWDSIPPVIFTLRLSQWKHMSVSGLQRERISTDINNFAFPMTGPSGHVV